MATSQLRLRIVDGQQPMGVIRTLKTVVGIVMAEVALHPSRKTRLEGLFIFQIAPLPEQLDLRRLE